MFIHHTNVQDAQNDQRRLVCYDCGIACDLGQMRSERLSFLGKMGAEAPGQRARLPMADDPRPDKRGPERLRPVQTGGTARRFRLHFTKLGPAALLGHLDLMRELPRIIRRAGIRTAYTEGFHPKPDVSMAPALSLGALSLAEFIDIKLIAQGEAHEILARLNEASTAGVRFVEVRELGPQDPAIGKVIGQARYLVVIAQQALAAFGGAAQLAAAISNFNSAEKVEVRRDLDGIGRIVNVRPVVRELRVIGPSDTEQIRESGLVGNLAGFSLTLALDGSGSARPSEIVAALLGPTLANTSAQFPHHVVRVEMSNNGFSPMQLQHHQRVSNATGQPRKAAPHAADPATSA